MCNTWGMAKKGRRATNEERLAAIRMYENGLSPDQITEIMEVGRSSLFEWIAKYRQGGLAAISTKFASGRPTVLDDSEMNRLYVMINGKDPRVYSFGLALWTRGLIRDLIKKTFGKDVSLVTVGRMLKKLGMSAQRPLYRSWKQDPERVERWKREEYPAIKARAAEVGATILFADEASVRTDYHAGTTWAPVGQTPVVTASAVRQAVKMVSAIGQARGVELPGPRGVDERRAVHPSSSPACSTISTPPSSWWSTAPRFTRQGSLKTTSRARRGDWSCSSFRPILPS